MKGEFVAVLLLAVLTASPALADVIELKTGQRVEGTFKQGTPASISVEVGGQTIRFDREKVRAIYFGAPPAASSVASPPSDQALRALRALRSITQAGVTYRDYTSRVGDANIQVDERLPAIKLAAPELAVAIGRAMTYYAMAAKAWEQTLGVDTDENKSARVALVLWEGRECPSIRELVAKRDRGDARMGEVVTQAVPTTWSCASDKIAEAEKLLSEKSK